MFDDPFNQWIIVPQNDWSALPPVDDDVSGLKDITSIFDPSDHYIHKKPARSRGLLLGEDLCPGLPDSDLFDAMTEFYKSPYTGGLSPPELSPDSSPASSSQAPSTPWLRTPRGDTPLVDLNAVRSPTSNTPWDIQEFDEFWTQNSGTCFVDETGQSLDDPSSQLSVILQEDVACTPFDLSGLSLSSPLPLASAMPSPLVYSPSPLLNPVASPILRSETSPFSLPPQPLPSQAFLAPPAPSYYRQETLSPVSTLSIFSPSPSPCPSLAPLPQYIPSPIIPPAVPPVSHFQDEKVSNITECSRPVRARRQMDSHDGDAPAPMIAKRKVEDHDDAEWHPSLERVKRPRVSSLQPARASPSTAPETSPDPDTQRDNIPTSCDQCGIRFSRSSDYLRHVQNSKLHPETSKLWKCPYCSSFLCRRDALSRHIKSNHPGHRVQLPYEGIPRELVPGMDAQDALRPSKRPQTKRPSRRGNRK